MLEFTTTIINGKEDLSCIYDEKHQYMAFFKGSNEEVRVDVEQTWSSDRFNPAFRVTLKKGQGTYFSVDMKNFLRGLDNIEIRFMK